MNLQRGRFFYITGCDGTGKTTQARLLLDHLRATGRPVKHLWLRFPFLLSIPLLAYARLRGFSKQEVIGGTRYGYWDFKESWLLRCVLPWLLVVDAALASIFKVYLPLWLGYSIVCERYVLDMLVDLAVGLEDPDLYRSLPGRLFTRLLPTDAVVIILDLNEETIQERRKVLKADKKLALRLAAFERLACGLNLRTLASIEPVENVNQSIREIAGI